ncbi:hypothetical protein ACKQTC_04975 [Peptococcus simiae]|uniref:Uncharacterized protein n=1 Tax=Peptococcus simiae TaxID=1643805 RepID=A0ABW9H0A4_9FIRM
MKTIDVYQCELGKTIPLEYVGRVRYFGESFGVDGLTDGKDYNLVKDETGYIKVVDDSEEDYIYSLSNPAPATGYSPGGIFKIVDDPREILKKRGLPEL